MGTCTAKLVVLILVLMVVGGGARVGATSFDPLPREQETAAREISPGETVFLFHSGTPEVRRSLKIGDVLGVFRVGRDGSIRSVGGIRATAFVGEFCLRGEVIEGRILQQDVAEKNRTYLLVIQGALCPR